MAKSIEDIAKALDVSVTTVRLVLQGKARQYRISEKTEKRVREYTDLHGAKVNHTARALRLKRTDSLALIVPRLSNAFFAELAERMEIRCRDAGLQLSISCCHDDPDTQLKLIEHFRNRNVDGLFLVPALPSLAKQAANIFKKRLVILDRDFGYDEIPTVITENFSSSMTLAEKLLDAQQTRAEPQFLFIAGNPQMPSISARIDGFQAALVQSGARKAKTELITVKKNRFDEGATAIEEYLSTHNELPQVLVTSSIALLQGALHQLKTRFNGIPESLDLATFDDHSMLDFLHNRTWSVRQDYQTMIDSAFNEMYKLLNDEDAPERHRVAMTVIERNSPSQF